MAEGAVWWPCLNPGSRVCGGTGCCGQAHTATGCHCRFAAPCAPGGWLGVAMGPTLTIPRVVGWRQGADGQQLPDCASCQATPGKSDFCVASDRAVSVLCLFLYLNKLLESQPRRLVPLPSQTGVGLVPAAFSSVQETADCKGQ